MRCRRMAAMLVTLMLGVGSAWQPSLAQPEALQEDMLRNHLSASRGIAPEAIRVLTSANIDLPTTGQRITKFKVLDEQTGEVLEVNIDSHGALVSPSEVQAELSARPVDHDKLHPALAQRLAALNEQKAVEQEPIPVILWFYEDDSSDAEQEQNEREGALGRESTTTLTESELDDLMQQMDAKRAARVEETLAPMMTALQAFDPGLRSDIYSPAIYAELTPDAIIEVQGWPEVAMVYEDDINFPALDVARKTVFAHFLESQGITGAGVRVAQIEVGGLVATANPYLAGTVQDATSVCSTTNAHSTLVAGIIRSTHASTRGIAPWVQLRAAGSCTGLSSQLQSRSTAAADWGAHALNLSFGAKIGLTPGANDRFYDDMVINRARTIVVAAGNEAGPCAPSTGIGNVLSPGLAYNAITVGNFDDRNTLSLDDNRMSACSSWRDPVSTNNDREKPEVAAPGTNITGTSINYPWINYTNSGTSFAAPIVTGTAALLMQRNSDLKTWPEAIKAILMTTALHNIEGSSRLSEKDGAGGIDADWADDLARYRTTKGTLGWGAQAYSCSTATNIDVATMSLVAGRTTRATIAWHQNPNYTEYTNRPSADLDLDVISPSGSLVVSSSSWDNTYEIVQFTPTTSGDYKLRVRKHRCSLTPRWLGFAWRRG